MNVDNSAAWDSKVVLLAAFIALLPPGLQAQNPTALDAPANGPTEVVDVQENGTVELVGENRVTLLFRETTESGGDTKIQKGLNNSLQIRRANDDLLYTIGEGFFIIERADIRVKNLAGNGTRMLVVDQSGLFKEAALPESLPPEGEAGGDLSGSYPDPELDPSTVVHTLNQLQGDLTIIAGEGLAIDVEGSSIRLSMEQPSPWDLVPGGISFSEGNVGIGTSQPTSMLDVGAGDIAAGSYRIGSLAALSRVGSNIAVGTEANPNGTDNIFFGALAGSNPGNSGNDNIFIGGDAGKDNTTGSQNIFIGEDAGSFNTSGRDNVFVGDDAGANNTTGKDNVFIGENSGYQNKTGDGNVFLGRNAGASADPDESDMLYIDNSSTSLPLIMGDFNNDLLILNGFVGIGEDPDFALELPNSNSVYGKARAFAWITYSSKR